MLTELFLQPSGDTPAVVASAGLRLRLDEKRIREFLMGESLYGDPSLALRELYQNAVDACRLADARRVFVGLAHDPLRVVPDIEFTQGVSRDGRPFVDCVDHGAGMGVDELTTAFCQAGVRASDLDARAEEVAAFAAADPPVELWLNSRFGIGVMSYFMIAESISVRTAILNRDGTTGALLSLHIPESGAEFDILDHGPAESHGTSVRLWLKPDIAVSAVSTLRDLVFCCPFSLRVADQYALEHRWLPGELNRASAMRGEGAFRDALVGIPGRLWWMKEVGTVLSDGIWADGWTRGMVVNLDGADTPKLTADRTRIVHTDHDAIEALGVSAAGSAVNDAWPTVGTSGWLWPATQQHHKVADAIVERAAERGLSVSLPSGSVTLHAAGFMPGDEENFACLATRSVLGWRFSRLAEAGHYSRLGVPASSRGVVPARPSDAILLGTMAFNYRHSTDLETSEWFDDATSIYEAERHLEYPMHEIIARARLLGLPLPPDADQLPGSNPIVQTALSFSRRQGKDGTFRPLCSFDILRASWEHRVPPGDVLAELEKRSIAFEPEALAGLDPLPGTNQLIAASENANGIAPWLVSSEPVQLNHLRRVAEATGRPSSEVLRWMRDLGFSELPTFRLEHIELTDDDLRMLSRDLDGVQPFIDADRPQDYFHLIKAARALNRSKPELTRRFADLGVTFLGKGEQPTDLRELSRKQLFARLQLTGARREQVSSRHLQMISRDGDRRFPWLSPELPIPAWTVATLALSQERSLDDVIADYHWLGYDVEDPRTVKRVLAPGPERPSR